MSVYSENNAKNFQLGYSISERIYYPPKLDNAKKSRPTSDYGLNIDEGNYKSMLMRFIHLIICEGQKSKNSDSIFFGARTLSKKPTIMFYRCKA